MFRHSKSRLLPGSHTTLILTVGVIVFYLSVSTFMIASQIRLSLPGVSKDQDVRIGLILCPAVKIHQQVRAVLVAPDI